MIYLDLPATDWSVPIRVETRNHGGDVEAVLTIGRAAQVLDVNESRWLRDALVNVVADLEKDAGTYDRESSTADLVKLLPGDGR